MAFQVQLPCNGMALCCMAFEAIAIAGVAMLQIARAIHIMHIILLGS